VTHIAVSESGDPTSGKLFSYASLEAAETSPDIYKEDPVFGCVANLRDFYAKSDLRLFSNRFGIRILNWEQLWDALVRGSNPGRVGETQVSRKEVMSEENTEVKPKKSRKSAEGGESTRVKKVLLDVPKRIQKNAVITVLVSENPKRGKSAEVFANYRNGITVEEFVKAGGSTGDVRWDIAHGFISIEQTEEASEDTAAAAE
jgi:hypothetical protein